MSATTSRAFSGDADLNLLVDFVRARMVERLPGATYWHPGDIVWQLYQFLRSGPLDEVRLWFDGDELAGFAIFEPPLRIQADIAPGAPAAIYEQAIEWAIELRRKGLPAGNETIPVAYQPLGTNTLATSVLNSDAERAAQLTAMGFQRGSTGETRFAANLDERPPSSLPAGYRLRHATDADLEERVDLHRDAWSVWGPSGTTVRTYRWLRAAPLYDETLDIVLESPDGRLVSYCVCWADAESGVATFEPVGTRPAFTGQGLAQATIVGALHRLRERGMHTALVSTSSENAPAQALYRRCGFRVIDTESFWTKRVVE